MAGDRGAGATTGLFLLTVLAWSGNYLFVRIGLAFATPLWLAALRAGVGAAGVLAYLAVSGSLGGLTGPDRRDALLLGLPNTAAFLGLWFYAAGQVPVGIAAVVIYTYPIWVALFTSPLLGTRLAPAHWLAVIGGFSGVALVSQPWSSGSTGVGLAPFVELLAAAVCWGGATVAFQRRFRPEQLASANGYQLLAGAVALVGVAAVVDGSRGPTPSPTLGVAVAWLGVFGTTFAYAVWFWLLERRAAATISAYLFLVPLGALALGVAFAGETVDLVQALGVALVLASIYGVPRSGFRVGGAEASPGVKAG